MKIASNKTPQLLCAATSLLVGSTLHAAGIPPLKISLSPLPDNTNVINVMPGMTYLVEYQMENVVRAAKTWLWAAPIPTYLSRTASISQPDCSNPVTSPYSFVIAPQGTCYFAVEVNGSAFIAQGNTQITYTPFFENSGAISYKMCGPGISITSPTVITDPMVAVGNYSAAGTPSTFRPLLVVSQDNGATWRYPSETNNPIFFPDAPPSSPFYQNGTFSSTSCSTPVCIAAGKGEDENGNTSPLLALSKDRGTTWIFPQSLHNPIFTPDNTNAFDPFEEFGGVFYSASCSGSNCVAVGYYTDINVNIRFLLAYTQDAGTTWTFPSSVNDPALNPAYISDANLLGASCSGNLCAAAGSYFGGDGTPFVAVTQDAGSNWFFPPEIQDPGTALGLDVLDSSLSGIDCDGTNCVASGSLIQNITFLQLPMLASSQDSGATWTYPVNIPQPVFVPNLFPFLRNGTLTSDACEGTSCVATGSYQDTGFTFRPLVAVSHDSGVTWNYPGQPTAPIFVPADPSTDFVGEADINGVSCFGTSCIFVGSYNSTGGIQRPLLAVSRNSGDTWAFNGVVTNPVFTPDDPATRFALGRFTSISCKPTICLASGFYEDVNGIVRPMVAYSVDLGNTWTFPASVTTPVFTPDPTPYTFNFGFLNDGTVTNASWMPESLKFMYPAPTKGKVNLKQRL